MTTQNIINQKGPIPQCVAYLSVSQVISNTTVTVVNLDTTIIDTTSSFNTSTHQYVPNVAGNYWIYVCGLWETGIGSYGMNVGIYKNGTDISSFSTGQAFIVSTYSQSNSNIIAMNGTTDFIDFRVDQGSGGNLTLASGTGNSYISATLIR